MKQVPKEEVAILRKAFKNGPVNFSDKFFLVKQWIMQYYFKTFAFQWQNTLHV